MLDLFLYVNYNCENKFYGGFQMDENYQNDVYDAPPPPTPDSKDNKPLISMIMGIASIVLGPCCCVLIGLGLGGAAIALSKKSTADDDKSNTFKKVGFITGIVGIVLTVLAQIVSLIFSFGFGMMDFMNYL
jgi:hypothetical protein